MAEPTFWPAYVGLGVLLLAGVWIGWTLMMRFVGTASGSHEVSESETNGPITPDYSLLAALMLAVGAGAQFLYSLPFGGPIDLLNYSFALRSGTDDTPNPFGFAGKLSGLVLVAFYLYLATVLTEKSRWPVWIGLMSAGVGSAYLLLSWLGRAEIMVFTAITILTCVSTLTRRIVPSIVIAAATIVITFILLNQVVATRGIADRPVPESVIAMEPEVPGTTVTGASVFQTIAGFLAGEFSFLAAGFFAHRNADTQFRWFYDIAVAPAYVLPSRVTYQSIQDIDDLTTALVKGAPKTMGDVKSTIPTDLLTLGYLQAATGGVLLVGSVFGMFLGALEKIVCTIRHAQICQIMLIAFGLKVGVLGILYASPALLMRNNFYLFAGLAILLLVQWLRMRSRPREATSVG